MRVLILALVFVMPLQAKAGFYSNTSDLVQHCDDFPTACAGYLGGFVDAWEMWRLESAASKGNEIPNSCVPDGVSVSQLRKVFLKYMDGHPEKLHKTPEGNIMVSFIKAFDC